MLRSVYKKEDITVLVNLAKIGDTKALEELIRRVQENIYSIFSHLTDKKNDVSDLTQETLIKMAKNLPSLKENEHFKSWLNRIITNVYYDYNKRNNRNSELELDENTIQNIKDKFGCEPGEKCLFTELENIIKKAIIGLPQNLRITLILREFENLTYEDISKITNVSLGTVKSRLSRARERLQQDLKEFR